MDLYIDSVFVPPVSNMQRVNSLALTTQYSSVGSDLAPTVHAQNNDGEAGFLTVPKEIAIAFNSCEAGKGATSNHC